MQRKRLKTLFDGNVDPENTLFSASRNKNLPYGLNGRPNVVRTEPKQVFNDQVINLNLKETKTAGPFEMYLF